MVLAENVEMFQSMFPGVTNFIGPIGFGFSGSGELIRLYNNNSMIRDSLVYDDQSPWPEDPDGNGPTLELIDPEFDNAQPSSWSASCSPYGTPGTINCIFSDIDDKHELESTFSRIFPNPFSNEAYFYIETNKSIYNGELMVFDLTGKEIRKYTILGNKTLIKREYLPKGFYVYRFTANSGNISGTGKLIVK
jgi:hypothetical protein